MCDLIYRSHRFTTAIYIASRKHGYCFNSSFLAVYNYYVLYCLNYPPPPFKSLLRNKAKAGTLERSENRVLVVYTFSSYTIRFFFLKREILFDLCKK